MAGSSEGVGKGEARSGRALRTSRGAQPGVCTPPQGSEMQGARFRKLRLAGSRGRVIGKAGSEVGRSARRLCDRLWLKPREPAL